MSDELWVEALAMRAGLTEAAARSAWNAVKALISEGLHKDGPCSVVIPGFGTFTKAIHKGHPLNLGVGPYTRIADYPVLKFKAFDTFRTEALGMDPKSYG